MTVGAVDPQEEYEAEPMDQIMDQLDVDTNDSGNNVQDQEPEGDQGHEKTMVPLSALQKKRERVKELELELQWEKQERQRMLQTQQQVNPEPKVDDSSRYESATREDLSRSQEEAIRVIEERLWIKQNPEKYERVTEFLPKFLKQRPNLASAINLASNRYEEAFELMDKLSPKQEQLIRKASAPAPRKVAPNAPGGVPKAAALNESVDVMRMSDKEFSEWRQAQKRNR